MAHTDEALPIRYYGTVVCLGMGKGIWAIAPLDKDLRDAGNQIVSILYANTESDLLWEEAIRLVSDEVIVSAPDSLPGDLVHVGHLFSERLSQGDVNLVVAIGPMEEVEQLGLVAKRQGCAFVALPAGH
ncbi:MAG: hypothetical protein WBB22_16580 [Anaerolineae bacterium]